MRILQRNLKRTTDTHYRPIPFHFSHNERTTAISSLMLELLKNAGFGSEWDTLYILSVVHVLVFHAGYLKAK